MLETPGIHRTSKKTRGERMRDFLEDNWPCFMVFGIIAALVVLGVIFICPHIKEREFEVKVISKAFNPSSSSTGVGYGMGSSGKGGMVMTTSFESEAYIIIYERRDNSKIGNTEIEADVWAKLERGDHLKLKEYVWE